MGNTKSLIVVTSSVQIFYLFVKVEYEYKKIPNVSRTSIGVVVNTSHRGLVAVGPSLMVVATRRPGWGSLGPSWWW